MVYHDHAFFPKLTYLGTTSGRTWVIDIPQLTWRFRKKCNKVDCSLLEMDLRPFLHISIFKSITLSDQPSNQSGRSALRLLLDWF